MSIGSIIVYVFLGLSISIVYVLLGAWFVPSEVTKILYRRLIIIFWPIYYLYNILMIPVYIVNYFSKHHTI